MARFTRGPVLRSGGDPLLRRAYEALDAAGVKVVARDDSDKGTSGTVRKDSDPGSAAAK